MRSRIFKSPYPHLCLPGDCFTNWPKPTPVSSGVLTNSFRLPAFLLMSRSAVAIPLVALFVLLLPAALSNAALLDFAQDKLEELASDCENVIGETLAVVGGEASSSASGGSNLVTSAKDGDGHGGAGIHYEPASGNAKFSVVLLHGLSAEVVQLAILATVGQSSGLQNTRFILPQAPEAFVNYRNRVEPSWFNIDATDPNAKEHRDEILASAKRVEDIIAGEEAKGVPKGNVAVVGMSQGGAVASTVYMRGPQIKASVLLATWLPLTSSYPAEQSAANGNLEAFMIHGSDDQVVELSWAKQSAEAMRSAGRTVDFREIADAPHVFGTKILQVASLAIQHLKDAGIN